ncbi:MAG: fumarylacetoacetate hydrolase family protein [Bacteroidota bacterium]|nr:fumarylacetoacetate hydrolase family protein [Bacteroidota bacterium]
MKLITYLEFGKEQIGLVINNKVYNLKLAASVKSALKMPDNMKDFLKAGPHVMSVAKDIDQLIKSGLMGTRSLEMEKLNILAPITRPSSLRDGYAFRQHVESARRNRGVEMIQEYDEYPIFYFNNHRSVVGPGEVYCMPDHFEKLDFELEWACIIGRKGINIKAEEAEGYIAGYTIMNDLSARTLQMEEMKLNLGPAKGKDFATVIGPMLVTADELESYKIPAKENHTGNNFNLEMKCWVNGIEVSKGNTGDMDWTFEELIERASYGTYLYPGDVIGSGTVGTGCFLELNGTGILNDPKNFKPQWLKDNDVVEMEITALGRLTNTIRRFDSDFSILARKKTANVATH